MKTGVLSMRVNRKENVDVDFVNPQSVLPYNSDSISTIITITMYTGDE
jgi:hypothetical protein